MQSSDKLIKLRNILTEMKSAVVAFSGGVDSTFLLKIAADTLGKNAIAAICKSASFPEREFDNIICIPEQFEINYTVIETDELKNPDYRSNPPDRCYICKKEIFRKLIEFSKQKAYAFVIEGSNVDDLKDYRPGKRAIEEMEIRSPLIEAGITKAEIRSFSKELNLSTWDKPSTPCLSSRIPYGSEITEEKLKQIDKAEEILHEMGFRLARVRHHDDIARIELPKEDMCLLIKDEKSAKIVSQFKAIGFSYVSLDLRGYRMGSLNEVLPEK